MKSIFQWSKNLTIRTKLLDTPLIYSPDQKIVYRDQHRYTYKTFSQRVKQLAAMLENLGVRPGDTVKKVVALSDTGDIPESGLEFTDEYETLMADTAPE